MATQLGKLLRIVRINTGDSMRDMADKLDLSVSYLSAIENGKRNVPANLEEKIFEAYELSDKDTERIQVHRTLDRAVATADVHHQAVVDVDPHVVVTAELEILPRNVLELRRNLHRETVPTRGW